jgi:Rhodopirellula transposase DDE domain
VSTSVGGKTRTGSDGDAAKGWDHDPPAREKLTPFGILMVASGALMLLFGSGETSDAWADALQAWWRQVRAGLGPIKRLVIYLDNGPKNSGRRTQFLKRMVEFADWSGLEVRLVYYPPYTHSGKRLHSLAQLASTWHDEANDVQSRKPHPCSSPTITA